MSVVVWMESWQPGDHTRSYTVGDSLHWKLSDAVAEDRGWLGPIIGSEIACEVTHVYDSQSRPFVWRIGEVTDVRTIRAIYSDGVRGGVPLPGSGTVNTVESAPRMAPDANADGDVAGYLIGLELEAE